MNDDSTPVPPAVVGTVRASSWSELFDCALRWYARNILGLRQPIGPRTQLGTSLHAGTAVYDSARARGEPPDAEAALATALQTLHRPTDEVLWSSEGLTPEEAERLVRDLLPVYAAATAGDTYTAVEMLCPPLDLATCHGPVRLTGTIDRLRRRDDGRLAVRDLKSGARIFAFDGSVPVYKYFMQTGVYRLLAEQTLGEPVTGPSEIMALDTGREPRVGLGVVPDERPALLGSEDRAGLIDLAAATLAAGRFPPNPASASCRPQRCPYYSQCRYHA